MRPLFNDAALLKHHDLVRVADRRETVGDDEAGSTCEEDL